MSDCYGKAYELFSQSCARDWKTYTEHQFVQQLADGTLPKDSFFHYLVQDYLYLIQYAKAWALGVVKADSPEEMSFCSHSVHTLVNVELKLHIELCEREGINKSSIINSNEDLEMIAYTRYLLAEAHNGDFLDLLAGVAPCTFGYGDIGRKLSKLPKIDNNPYQEWIDTYSGEDYQSFCIEMGQMLDKAIINRLGENFWQTPLWKKLCKTYTQATQLEIAFWQMGLRGKIYQ